MSCSSPVLDASKLQRGLEALRDTRDKDVLDMLVGQPSGVPCVVTLTLEGDDSAEGSASVSTYDLLLSTCGRFQVDHLSRCSSIQIPEASGETDAGAGREALAFAVRLMKNLRSDCTPAVLCEVIRQFNFLSAEAALNCIYASLTIDELTDDQLLRLLEAVARYNLGHADRVFKRLLRVLQASRSLQVALVTGSAWKRVLPLALALTSGTLTLPLLAEWLEDLRPSAGPLAMLLHFALLTSMSDAYAAEAHGTTPASPECLSDRGAPDSVGDSQTPSPDAQAGRECPAAVDASEERHRSVRPHWEDAPEGTPCEGAADTCGAPAASEQPPHEHGGASGRAAPLHKPRASPSGEGCAPRAGGAGGSRRGSRCKAGPALTGESSEASMVEGEDALPDAWARQCALATPADRAVDRISTRLAAWLSVDLQAVSRCCLQSMSEHAMQATLSEQAALHRCAVQTGVQPGAQPGPAQAAMRAVMEGLIASRSQVPACHAMPVHPRWDGHEQAKEWRPAGMALQRNGRTVMRTVMRWNRPALHCFLPRTSHTVTYTLGKAKLQVRLQNEGHTGGGSSMFVSLICVDEASFAKDLQQLCKVTLFAVPSSRLSEVVEGRAVDLKAAYSYCTEFTMWFGTTLGATPWTRLESLRADYPQDMYVVADVEMVVPPTA